MLIQTKPLKNALAGASRFAGGRTPNEPYCRLRLHSCGGELQLSAENACGTINVSTKIPVSELDVVVDYVQFHRAVGASNLGEIDLSVLDRAVLIKADKSKIKLPTFDPILTQQISRIEDGVTASTEEFASAPGKLAFIGNTKEMTFAQGQRLYANNGRLEVLASSGRVTGGVCMSCQGDLDIIVPHESMEAVSTALKKLGGQDVLIRQVGGRATFQSGQVVLQTPTTLGKRPWTREQFDQMTSMINEWKIPRREVADFLAQVAIFTTEFCTGIDVLPTEEGLVMEFNGLHDEGVAGTHSSGTCSTIIPGNVQGEPVIVRHEAFRKMVENCSDDWIVKGSTKGVAVVSGGFFAVHSGITRVSL